MTELFALNVRNIDVTEELLDKVSARRREYISRVKNPNAKKLCLGAGLLVAKLIGQDEKTDDKGKPFVFGKNEFSISHSEDIVLIAVSDKKVGADIEFMDKKDVLKLAKRFMTGSEYRIILASEHPQKEFYAIWTKKESFVKMQGTGFDKDPSKIDVLYRTDCKFFTCEYHQYMISVCFNDDIEEKITFFEAGELF